MRRIEGNPQYAHPAAFCGESLRAMLRTADAGNPAVSFAVFAVHTVSSTSLDQKLRSLARSHFEDRSRRRGLLVAFEGPDGSGKTTQRKLFKTWLKSEGYDVVTTKWNSSDLIKPIIKSRKAVRALSPEEFSLLHAADFRHRVEQRRSCRRCGRASWSSPTGSSSPAWRATWRAGSISTGCSSSISRCSGPTSCSTSRCRRARREQARRRHAHAELLRGRPGRHRHRRSGGELRAVHHAGHPRIRIARADLQLHHRRRRAVDRRSAPARSASCSSRASSVRGPTGTSTPSPNGWRMRGAGV